MISTGTATRHPIWHRMQTEMRHFCICCQWEAPALKSSHRLSFSGLHLLQRRSLTIWHRLNAVHTRRQRDESPGVNRARLRWLFAAGSDFAWPLCASSTSEQPGVLHSPERQIILANSANATAWVNRFARHFAQLECSGWIPTFEVSDMHHMLKMHISANGSMFNGCGSNFLSFEEKKGAILSPRQIK